MKDTVPEKGDWSWREGEMEDELRRDPWGKGEDKRQMGIWETEAQKHSKRLREEPECGGQPVNG